MLQGQTFRHIFSYIFAASGALFISACTTIKIPKTPLMQTVTPQTQWQKYQHNLQGLTKWQASGVIGVIMDHKGKSANFIWKQNKQDFWIQIYGPLGIGATTFCGDHYEVKLKYNNGEVVTSQSLEQLMRSQLGWSLPIAGLYYWARGLYMPQIPHSKTLNNFGLVQTLKQQGWQIQYKDYMLYDNQYPLAEKIIFRYGNDLKMTLVIKAWLLNP